MLGTKKYIVMVVRTGKISVERGYPKKYHFEKLQPKTSVPQSESAYDESEDNESYFDDESSLENPGLPLLEKEDSLPSRKALLAGTNGGKMGESGVKRKGTAGLKKDPAE